MSDIRSELLRRIQATEDLIAKHELVATTNQSPSLAANIRSLKKLLHNQRAEYEALDAPQDGAEEKV